MPWLRWLLPVSVLLAAVGTPGARERPEAAASSGTHAWWSRPVGDRHVIEHLALESGGERSGLHEVADFQDAPVAMAASGDRVWVAFAPRRGRCEIVSGQARRNPASGLWFTMPPTLRLCASLPASGQVSMAAVGHRLLAVSSEGLMGLVGERWLPRPLPEGVQASECRLVGSRESVWLLRTDSRGVIDRWRLRESVDVAWEPWPLQVLGAVESVGGGPRLAFVAGEPPRLGQVELGEPRWQAQVPSDATVLGWGDGFTAVTVTPDGPQWAQVISGADTIDDFEPIRAQSSVAERWFHLPVLGVLSLGAIMVSLVVRLVRGGGGTGQCAPHPACMPLGRRMAALAADVLPSAAAVWIVFDADWADILVPPVWSFNLGESLPFVWMTLGTVLFGTLEESVGARSLGKRMFGGQVVARSGSRAGLVRHLVRNLLKGLAMISPVVALPALVDRFGEGVAETISGTRVLHVPDDRS